MAIGLLFELPGMTREQYEAARDGGDMDAALPPGAIAHIAGPIEGGWRVIDVWESRADFDRFAEEVLAPAMGGQAPVPVEFEIHTVQT